MSHDADTAQPTEQPRQPITDDALQFKDLVRTPADLQRLSNYSRRAYMPLVLSALLPIVVAAGGAAADSGISIAVNVVAWLVFVFDLVVHMRLINRYLKTRSGKIDLVIVLVTAPWFLIPGLGASQILVVARLARLVRLLFISKGARRAGRQLSRVGLLAFSMMLFGSWMAYVAEHPTNPGFATFGDAIWWGMVTLTTVGYGDIVPITQTGRIAGVVLMITGVATLGLIAGALASAFGFGADTSPGERQEPSPAPSAPTGPAELDVAATLVAIRAELAAIDRRLSVLADAAESDPANP
jgi:voltage-gated potassium channel